jgi:hypothetical protein
MKSIRSIILFVACVAAGASCAQGAEKTPPSHTSCVPRYLCICPSYCCKPMPKVCWDYAARCDDYCAKPLPCLCYPCVKYGCDTYDCKPLPCCYPKAPCPVR